MSTRKLRLAVSTGKLAVCRLAPDAAVPAWAAGPTFVSTTRTERELSIVTAEERVPPNVRVERGWRRLEVRGPLDFSDTGVLAALAEPLADAGIAIFVLSTFDTDHLLVKEKDLARAVETLTAFGHEISAAS